MPTLTTIGTNILINRLGLNDPGGSVSASDLQTIQIVVNEMLSSWNLDRPLIFTIREDIFPLTSGTGTYTIGTGGTFDTTPYGAPNHIEMAYIKVGNGRNDLKIVNAIQYRMHNDLAATASVPDELYPDYSFGVSLGNISFWPIPNFSGSESVAINYWQPLASFPDLTTNIPLKDGYQEAIEWNAALRLLGTFGASISTETANLVATEAAKSQKRVRDLNILNGLLPPESQVPPTPPPSQTGRVQ